MSTSRNLLSVFAAALLSLTFSAQETERGDVRMLEGDGSNPICLEGAIPVANSMWHAKIDASMIPGAQGAMLILSSAAWSTGALDTDFGQILIDPEMRIYNLNRPLNIARVQFGVPVPNDPAVIGETYYAQALVYGQKIQQLCNALELTVGDIPAPRPRD